MKKLYIILALLGFTYLARAQDGNQRQRKQDVEALKVAFISRELELTPDEAQRFWPVYNEYARELKTIVRDDEDVLVKDEKVLNLRKRYQDQFSKILGAQRMNKLYNAESKFRQVLIKAIRNQKNQKENNRLNQRLR